MIAKPFFAAILFLGAVVAGAAPASATEITRVVSPGGIEAWLVEEHSIPMLAVRMAWRGGARLDPEGRDGLANMLSSLLDEGAGEYDSQAFQARLDDLAVRLSFDAGMDSFRGNLQTLTENRDEAFRLLQLALTQPRFDAEPVERMRRQILTGLKRKETDPNSIAGRKWFELAFPGHAYGRDAEGTPETVAALTADDLKAYLSAHLARDNMVISVVGDISAAELGPLLDRTFGPLPAAAAPEHLDPVALANPGRVEVVEQDIPQSVVVFGGAGIARDDPDYYAAYVMNYILGGGGFESRLTEEVREKRGLAYSVYAYLYPLDASPLFLGGLGTNNGKVSQSLEIVRREIGRMGREGVTAEELEGAKTYLNGSFPLRLSSNASIANILVAMQLDNLGIDYLDRRAALIDAVNLDDVKRVAARILDPGRLLTVIVGKPGKRLEKG